ncbi:hypothetical protein FRB99_002051, partial [Tulasnella sp. 403]
MSQKVVLVTGCSTGGIGFSLCKEFAKRGCIVYGTSRRLETMEGLASDSIRVKELDVCDDDVVNRVSKEIIDEAGTIDIVVSNAGYLETGPVMDVSIDKMSKMFNTNTLGTMRLAQAIIPHMAARKSGLFVIVGSVTGLAPTPWTGAYAATKAALHSFAASLKMECTPFGVQVMLLAPGGVKSQVAQNSSLTYKMPETSLYKSYSDAIIARMWASQTWFSMPTDEFTRQTVDKVLKTHPPHFVSIGEGAYVWKILAWLPRWVTLWLFWRVMGRTNTHSIHPRNMQFEIIARCPTTRARVSRMTLA